MISFDLIFSHRRIILFYSWNKSKLLIWHISNQRWIWLYTSHLQHNNQHHSSFLFHETLSHENWLLNTPNPDECVLGRFRAFFLLRLWPSSVSFVILKKKSTHVTTTYWELKTICQLSCRNRKSSGGGLWSSSAYSGTKVDYIIQRTIITGW